MFSRISWFRTTYGLIILSVASTACIGIALLQSKSYIFHYFQSTTEAPATVQPFPVGVNSVSHEIIENPNVESYFTDTFAYAPESSRHWWNKVAAVLASKHWYQNLASPVSRIVVIWPGERKEEVTKHISGILGWNEQQSDTFQTLTEESVPVFAEGKFYPGQYVVHKDATPEELYQLVSDEFTNNVTARYTSDVQDRVPLAEALIIASLLEREASDFDNMREISGVIWNRLFIDMPLQLDATLQYVKGSNEYEPQWWPQVKPQDKFLSSPFNTYENIGLPPEPIANPTAEAILAALNPLQTDCLYYFHAKREYYCSSTYEEHVTKLRVLYGQGS